MDYPRHPPCQLVTHALAPPSRARQASSTAAQQHGWSLPAPLQPPRTCVDGGCAAHHAAGSHLTAGPGGAVREGRAGGRRVLLRLGRLVHFCELSGGGGGAPSHDRACGGMQRMRWHPPSPGRPSPCAHASLTESARLQAAAGQGGSEAPAPRGRRRSGCGIKRRQGRLRRRRCVRDLWPRSAAVGRYCGIRAQAHACTRAGCVKHSQLV